MSQTYSNVFVGALPPIPSQAISPLRTELQRRLSETAEQPVYILLEIPEDGLPVVLSFETVQALTAAVIERSDSDMAVFMFLGHQLHRSAAPDRYLITPLGNHPLFTRVDPTALLIDRNPNLGTPLPLPCPPRVPPPVQRARQPLRVVDIEGQVPIDAEETNIFPESDV